MRLHYENIILGEEQRTKFTPPRDAVCAWRAEAADRDFGALALVAPVLLLIKNATEGHSFDAIPRFLVFEFLLLF